MSMETDEQPKIDNLILGEIQVLLAEKRAALASMRTGIAVFALPLSVLSVLIATSRYLQHGKGAAFARALVTSELGSRRARLLADLPFDPAASPLRPSHPGAHPEI